MRSPPWFLLPLLAAPLLSSIALADEAAQVEAGRAVYLAACATCHGETGRGDGPMSAYLTLPVPDLTAIAARRGGDFPWLTIVHIVDGRSGLRGHGGPMPIFGAVFQGDTEAADAPDGSPVITSARVLAVVAWLATIQK